MPRLLKIDWDVVSELCRYCHKDQVEHLIKESGFYDTDYTSIEYDELKTKIRKAMLTCSDCCEAIVMAHSED